MTECDSWRERNVYIAPTIPVADLPPGSILPLKEIYSVKQNQDGSDKEKCRVVALGNKWINTQNVPLYSPTPADPLDNCMYAIAAADDLNFELWDVKTAFLYGNPPAGKPQIVRRPKGFTDKHMPLHMQLQHMVYGYPPANAEWHRHHGATYRNAGFRNLKSSPCFLILQRGNSKIIVSTNVDDGKVFHNDQALADEMFAIISKTYHMTRVIEPTLVLGIRFTRDRPKRIMSLSQTASIEDTCALFDVDTTKVKHFPRTPMLHNWPTCSETILKELTIPLNPEQTKKFERKLGCVQWVTQQTRFDNKYAMARIAGPEPSMAHLHALNRSLLYLAGTKDLALTFNGKDGVKLHVTMDSSFASHPDKRSHTCVTGHIGKNSGAFHMICKKQPIMADSTCYAETISVHKGCQFAHRMGMFCEELGYPQHPVPTFNDNKSTITASHKSSPTPRTNHFDIKSCTIYDYLQRKIVTLQHLASEELPADLGTKALGTKLFEYLRQFILGLNIAPLAPDVIAIKQK